MSKTTRLAAGQVLKDKPIRDELLELSESGRTFRTAAEWDISPSMVRAVVVRPDGPAEEGRAADAPGRPFTEAVVRKFGRPSLLVRNGRISEVPESAELRRRLHRARGALEARLGSVGRIELISDKTDRGSLGTGWVVAERVVVTNRHVAEIFAERSGKKFRFARTFLGDTMSTCIDFREEVDSDDALEIEVAEIVFVEDPGHASPDVALLRLKSHGRLPPPVPVARAVPAAGADIAVVGFPAFDDRGGPAASDPIRRVYGNIFDVKRLAPGQVLEATDSKWFFAHDATTLGGNSGSAVIDMETGHAVGLHFSGEYFKANYAVRSATVLDYLAKRKIKVTVPDLDGRGARPARSRGRASAEPIADSDDELLATQEAPPASYRDREGYQEDFIDGVTVPLPRPGAKIKKEVLEFTFDGKKMTELKYVHFSVVMSKSRRLCFYSAVNIDGEEAVAIRGSRPSWRRDSRIPDAAQIIKECYGDERDGKFSRGHMTRREDPNWGERHVAERANADSMHVTNACPQMQPYNGGIWLGLEDYALQNAKRDNMRICVFTGPFFTDNDPTMFDVEIPVEFWKVIAFIHDDTGKLSATGYSISQQGFLPGPEFVFGRYETHQRPIKHIEQRTGLSFGKLTAADGLKAVPEAAPRPLMSLRDIQF